MYIYSDSRFVLQLMQDLEDKIDELSVDQKLELVKVMTLMDIANYAHVIGCNVEDLTQLVNCD